MKPSLFCAAFLVACLGLSACGGGADAEVAMPVVAVASPARLAFDDTVAGSGAEALAGSRVQVSYTAWLYDAAAPGFKGVRVDASAPNKPFSFVVGAQGTPDAAIAGISQGVQGMRTGGKRTILIPSSLAYGTSGYLPLIPGNAGLVFEVELLKVCAGASC